MRIKDLFKYGTVTERIYADNMCYKYSTLKFNSILAKIKYKIDKNIRKEVKIIIDSSVNLNTTINKIKRTIEELNISEDTKIVFVVKDKIYDATKINRVEKSLKENLNRDCKIIIAPHNDKK